MAAASRPSTSTSSCRARTRPTSWTFSACPRSRCRPTGLQAGPGAGAAWTGGGGWAARVDLTAVLGTTKADVEGLIGDVRSFQSLDLDIVMSGEDPSDILDIFGLPEISLPPYRVAGRLGREGSVIRVQGLDGRVGDS